MSDSLSDFLHKPKPNQIEMGGTFQCQHCEEIIANGIFDPNEKILTWFCKNHHKSQIGLNV